MQVEEVGIETTDNLNDAEQEKKFVEFIERRKVVMLEDVAAEFKMMTKEVVDRIETL